MNADWFGRDHVLIVQASANLDTPEYARQLWDSAEDPTTAAMQLIAALVKQRGLAVGPDGGPVHDG